MMPDVVGLREGEAEGILQGQGVHVKKRTVAQPFRRKGDAGSLRVVRQRFLTSEGVEVVLAHEMRGSESVTSDQ